VPAAEMAVQLRRAGVGAIGTAAEAVAAAAAAVRMMAREASVRVWGGVGVGVAVCGPWTRQSSLKPSHTAPHSKVRRNPLIPVDLFFPFEWDLFFRLSGDFTGEWCPCLLGFLCGGVGYMVLDTKWMLCLHQYVCVCVVHCLLGFTSCAVEAVLWCLMPKWLLCLHLCVCVCVCVLFTVC